MNIEKEIKSINAKLAKLIADSEFNNWMTWEQFEEKTCRKMTKSQRFNFKVQFIKCIRTKGRSTLINYKKWVEEHEPVIGRRY